MSYIRAKIINGRSYLYLVESKREGNKVIQKHLKYLGRGTKADIGPKYQELGITPSRLDQIQKEKAQAEIEKGKLPKEAFGAKFGVDSNLSKKNFTISLDHATIFTLKELMGSERSTQLYTDENTKYAGNVKHKTLKEVRALNHPKDDPLENAVYVRTPKGEVTKIGGDNYYKIVAVAKKYGIPPSDIRIRTRGMDYPVVFAFGDKRILTAPVIDEPYAQVDMKRVKARTIN